MTDRAATDQVEPLPREARKFWRSKSPQHLHWASIEDLGRKSAKGGLMTAGGSWIRFVVQLLATIFLARILGPQEYGVAVVMVVFAAASGLVRDSGLSTFVIQRPRLSPKLVSSMHFVSLGAAILLAATLVSFGPLISKIFDDDRYSLFAVVASLTFLFAGGTAIPSALMARNLEFGKLALIDTAAVVASCSVGLIFATQMGAFSLVLQVAVNAFIQYVLVLITCPWKPGRPAKQKQLRLPLTYAASVSSVQVLNFLSSNIDKLLVGSLFGTRAAGYYSQAVQLMVLPLQQVNGPLQKVFVPALSRLNTDPQRFRRFFRAIVTVVGYVLWPAFGVLAVFADSVIVVLFGPQWEPSAAIFSILAIAGVAQSIGYINAWIFIAIGETKRNILWSVASRVVVIGGLLVGARWGVQGVAVSYSITSAICIIPGFLIVRKRAGLGMLDLLRPILWPALLAVFAVAAAKVVYIFAPPGGSIGILMLDLIFILILGIMSVILIRPARTEVLEIMSLLKRR